ncbi:MAG: hypothetical protein MUP85_09885, partial [Candidatus Lokiarchaeota archaeon]|nr:hypothetical protein [Candidatus Lokiarchaeota archaeon]
MNQVFNPVFAFKRIFEEEDANRVFSQLSCHPILWELISIENFFASAVRLFGTDLEKWTPKNIIINIDSLADLNDPATKPKQNHDYLPVLMEITDISASIKEIANKRKNKEPWVKILQDFQLDVINECEITRKWGTVFSIYLEEPDERIELEKILIYQSNDEYVFLALLINLYQDKTWISDFLSRNLEFIINHSNTIKKLVFNLEKIGGQHVAHQLVEELLNNPKFGKKIIDCGKSCFSIESPFEKIEKINDFRFLSLFINDTEKANLFELLAKDILEKSLIIKPVKLYNQDLDLDIDDLLSLDFYI